MIPNGPGMVHSGGDFPDTHFGQRPALVAHFVRGVISPPDQGLEASSWHNFPDTSWHNEVCQKMVRVQPSSSEIPADLLTPAHSVAKSPTKAVYSAGVIGLSPGSSTTSLKRSTTSGAW